jgi:hypothetical protein
MPQATALVDIDRLLADAGYDSERNHVLCREELGIRSTVIAINPRPSRRRWPKTRYRRQMRRRFHCRVYGQRWQAESAISRNKRILGSSLRARRQDTQLEECLLRVLTHNLLILLRPLTAVSPERQPPSPYSGFSTEQIGYETARCD